VPRKFHTHVCIHPPHSDDRTPRLVCRDCLVMLNVQAVLRAQGLEDGDAILDLPLRKGASPRNTAAIVSRYGPDDTIGVYTRFPLDDDKEHRPKKFLTPTNTTLEGFELKAARAWFSRLDRAQMSLASRAQALLAPGLENHHEVFFSQGMWAPIQRLHGERSKRRVARQPVGQRTLAFVLNQRELWPRGPALNAIFAMDSATAVGWSGILRYRHPEWVTAPGFRMVELTLTSLPDYIEDTRFGLDWKEETLLYAE
jgi:hypothetical protein